DVEVFPGGLMRALRPVILIPALLVAGWPPPALSDVEPVGPEIPVSTFLPGSQQSPAVATDASGGFVVVWQSGSFYGATQDGSSSGGFGPRFGPSGTPLGGEIPISATTPRPPARPRLA